MTETRWIIGAALEPAKGHRIPLKTEEYEQHEQAGWEPAGPSSTFPTPDMMIIFVLMKRPVLNLGLFQAPGEIPT